jgi:hypothetical protein
MSTGTPYRILGEKPEDWLGEANRVFELISNRLDALEGYRGHGTFYNYIEMKSDVLVTDSTKGVVLKDNGNPASYWRIRVNSAGTIVITNIGRTYP